MTPLPEDDDADEDDELDTSCGSLPNASPYVAVAATFPVATADWTTFVTVAVAVRYCVDEVDPAAGSRIT